MQGGQSYWFPQLTAVLLFNCSCFFSFSPTKMGQFSCRCFSLAQEICNPLLALLWGVAYLSPPTHTLSLHCLSSVCLLIVHTEISSLPLPFLQWTFSVSLIIYAVMLNYSLLFAIQFCWGGGSIFPGLCWFVFLGVAGEVLYGGRCSPVCSVKWRSGKFGVRGSSGSSSSSKKWLLIFSV
jgi:hypothetical protein